MANSFQNNEWVFHSPKFLSDINNPNLSTSPWAGHRYFAYDLISFLRPKSIVELGTHFGCSFFCFAQAIKDQKIPTTLIAVDTWQGDEHAGFYDDSVLKLVNETIADHFTNIDVRLARKTFDEALPDVDNASVDIIHIDGLHTYDAVKHDFDTWKNKLKKDGVILFHDIDKSSGYGSSDFWYEIREEYPSYTFGQHSFGLGVLFPNGSAVFNDLQWYLNNGALHYYEHRSNAELFERQICDMSEMLEKRLEIMTKMDEMIKQRDDYVVSLEKRVDAFTLEAKNVSLITAERDNFANELTGQKNEIRELLTNFEEVSSNFERLKKASKKNQTKIIRLKQLVESNVIQIKQSKAELNDKTDQIDELEVKITKNIAILKTREKTITQQNKQIQSAHNKLHEEKTVSKKLGGELSASNKKILGLTKIIEDKTTSLNDLRGYNLFINKYSASHKSPRENFSQMLKELTPKAQFPEMGITLYAFTRKLISDLRQGGVKDIFFLSREGELLINLFDRLQRKMYAPEERIRAHYIKVSRRATFLMSLKPLEEEDFFVLFRQYRRIAPSEFLRSLALDPYINDIAADIGETREVFDTRCEDLPTNPIFEAIRTSAIFQKIYEQERTRRSSNFKSYFEQFGSDLSNLQLHVVDVGWKGSIQDNLYNWFTSTYGSHAKVFGYYLGLVATGNAHELNVKNGLLLSTLKTFSQGAEIYNENRALFEILLPASHGSADDYIRCEDGTVEAKTEIYVEEAMIEAHVRPIVNTFMNFVYVAIDFLDHHGYDLDVVMLDALHFHKRMNFSPTQTEMDWFHSISHVENFGLFEAYCFTGNAPLPNLIDRVKFSRSMLKLENRLNLGFWPWLHLRDKAMVGASQLYKLRQLKRAHTHRR